MGELKEHERVFTLENDGISIRCNDSCSTPLTGGNSPYYEIRTDRYGRRDFVVPCPDENAPSQPDGTPKICKLLTEQILLYMRISEYRPPDSPV